MPEPERIEPSRKWRHIKLYREIKQALYAIPAHFKSETHISGIQATDIFTLGETLSATMEDQVVVTLNNMRPYWDPDGAYRYYAFVRQPQTFPDAVLRCRHPREGEDEIILGIELKAWYLLAKEGVPSLRFRVTPAACAPQDLIAVVPWALSNVISGEPKVFVPFVESARYAAEYRNYWWQAVRETKLSREIKMPANAQPYPVKSDQIADIPVSDTGDNFGRLARATGFMEEYLENAKSQKLAGIDARYWLKLFRAIQEGKSREEIEEKINKLL